MLKNYFLGYLNSYFIICDFVLGSSNISYKDYKISGITQYLDLKAWQEKIVRGLFGFVVVLELPISFVIITYRLIYYIIMWSVTRQKHLNNSNILISTGEVKTKQIISTSDYQIKDITVVMIPFVNKKIYEGFEVVSAFSILNLIDVLKSYGNAAKTIVLMKRKYGHRDILTRSYSSFEYYLACFLPKHIDSSNTFVFTSTYSRWGFLHGQLQNQTVFLQHGWLSNKTLYLNKIGFANKAYYINEEQKNTCELILFKNKPEAHYLKLLQFNITPSKDKVNILLICESSFMNRQIKIIDEISKNNRLRLYVKPHPKDKNIKYFEDNEKEKGYILLKGYNFPAVDYAISYESTLAVEYEMKGVKVLLYNQPDFNEQYNRLLNLN